MQRFLFLYLVIHCGIFANHRTAEAKYCKTGTVLAAQESPEGKVYVKCVPKSDVKKEVCDPVCKIGKVIINPQKKVPRRIIKVAAPVVLPPKISAPVKMPEASPQPTPVPEKETIINNYYYDPPSVKKTASDDDYYAKKPTIIESNPNIDDIVLREKNWMKKKTLSLAGFYFGASYNALFGTLQENFTANLANGTISSVQAANNTGHVGWIVAGFTVTPRKRFLLGIDLALPLYSSIEFQKRSPIPAFLGSDIPLNSIEELLRIQARIGIVMASRLAFYGTIGTNLAKFNFYNISSINVVWPNQFALVNSINGGAGMEILLRQSLTLRIEYAFQYYVQQSYADNYTYKDNSVPVASRAKNYLNTYDIVQHSVSVILAYKF